MIKAIEFSALIIFVHMNVWYIISLIRKRNDTVDTAWGLGFIVVAVTSLFYHSNLFTRQLLTLLLVTLWGLRLAIYIFIRNKNKKEDYRYQEMKNKWGKNFLINTYFKIFITQGILMLLVSLSLITITSTSGKQLNWLDAVGAFVWIIGFFFEAVGDWQLHKFVTIPSNKGRIMKYGLWKYTRHPNYFGEVTMWWGIFLLSLSHPYKLVSVLSPIAITLLITKVSGIPLLEKKYKDNEEFIQYKKNTSIFFPFFGKKNLK